MQKGDYIFASERLGFRSWRDSDVNTMASINRDEEVMQFFPSTQSREQTEQFMKRMNELYKNEKFCFFAVDILDSNEFAGFVGLSRPSFQADFTPCVEIGWRLARKAWCKGYATEGARRCLEYAFNTLHLDKVYSYAPAINEKSECVMQKIGMEKVKNFDLILLKDYPHLENCVLYVVEQEML